MGDSPDPRWAISRATPLTRVILLAGVFTALAGCGDVIESNHATLAAAMVMATFTSP